MSSAIAQFQYLSLLSKISIELKNTLVFEDDEIKTLAEFIISLAQTHSLEEFRSELDESGGDIIEYQVKNSLYNKVQQFYTEINSNANSKPIPDNSHKSLSLTTDLRMNPPSRSNNTHKSLSLTTDLRMNPPSRSNIRDTHKDINTFRSNKRISSPERFEMAQLKAAGLKNNNNNYNNDFKDDYNIKNDQSIDPYEDYDIDIEFNDEEPNFLQGQNNVITTSVDAIKVVQNPEGSLQRAALTQASLLKERKEMLKEQQKEDNNNDTFQNEINTSKHKIYKQKTDREIIVGASDDSVTGFHDDSYSNCRNDFGQKNSSSIKKQRENLPIFQYRVDLLNAIEHNDLMIVVGETGSGKTTQIPQFLFESGYSKYGKIGCTQPRRVAAVSISKRVCQEMDCVLGKEVGYSIRFDDMTSPSTIIKYMTDGMLLRECLLDSNMEAYSVIILDEAHERTIHTDVLFGLMKQCLARRNKSSKKRFKLIVTSATLDIKKFAQYFNNCPIFSIPGRLYPVDIMYAREPEPDYLEAALLTVLQIHVKKPLGDILLFLTGRDEIDTACQILQNKINDIGNSVSPLIILPVYSALPSEVQTKIFEPTPQGSRKCVVATNIAEASLTIDGIYYVVDPGFCKQKIFDSKLGMDSLVVTPISQASANQRAGRAGRTGKGECYRLYTEEAYKTEMLPVSIPEIQRSNLGNVVLTLKAIGINDIIAFDFMDPPPHQTLVAAMEQLYALGALDEYGLLTPLGRKMAEFPLEPELSKMLLTSVDLQCSEEILTIVAMLSVESVFARPKDKQALADQKKIRFNQPEGDHLTLLTLYNAWIGNKEQEKKWCFDNFIQLRALRKAYEIRRQLVLLMRRFKLALVNCDRRKINLIRMSIVSGFFTNAAKKDPQEGYKTLIEGTPVYIHPSSSLFHHQPEWVIYHGLILTTREYMHEVLAIEPRWLIEQAPRYYRMADPSNPSTRKRSEKLQPFLFSNATRDNTRQHNKRKR